jgi:hypothetical protein
VEAPPNGAKLVLSAERADVHLFDPASGASLRQAAKARR